MVLGYGARPGLGGNFKATIRDYARYVLRQVTDARKTDDVSLSTFYRTVGAGIANWYSG